MAIAKAVERDGYVYLYDANGASLCNIGIGHTRPEDGLKSYTSSTVTVRRLDYIYTYDERGQQIGSATPVR